MDVAKALGASLKAQTVQVFIEGLGILKDFIKARNPPTLEKAIQAAREEERVRNSNEEAKKLYGTSHKPSPTVNKSLTCFNCSRTGHMAKDCRAKEKRIEKPSTQPSIRSIQNLTCNYCKKPGHLINDCRKRKYVNEKKAAEQGNSTKLDTIGGRPVGDIKLAANHKIILGEKKTAAERFADKPSTSNQN